MEGATETNLLPQQPVVATPVQHPVPKCQSCGAAVPWKVEPIFLPRHWIVGIISLFAGGAGIFYLAFIWLIRRGDGRAKICPMCGARNMWTFIY